ncbi:conserved hypothetical protein (plasmid) [Rhodococcus jostii RHA1]|uniref:Uncharacterized protein n=1 Tax=Rhodococcus jostii (strain RHA1) TaxID=101510 RepID=Q0RVX1_RHOJR|nr:conserved hypothetical protein [Rhodococcus jostii RHA1]
MTWMRTRCISGRAASSEATTSITSGVDRSDNGAIRPATERRAGGHWCGCRGRPRCLGAGGSRRACGAARERSIGESTYALLAAFAPQSYIVAFVAFVAASRRGPQLMIAHSGQDETVSDRTAADLERELAMLADVRDRLRASEGNDFRIPTTAVDQVLDEFNTLERSPRDPT